MQSPSDCTPDNMLPFAGDGQPLTLVCTDVEGSTELWEWDTTAMLQAVAAHDRAMRSLMVLHHGYEVWTEGDAFLVAFHTPEDASAWSMAVQQVNQFCAWCS